MKTKRKKHHRKFENPKNAYTLYPLLQWVQGYKEGAMGGSILKKRREEREERS